MYYRIFNILGMLNPDNELHEFRKEICKEKTALLYKTPRNYQFKSKQEKNLHYFHKPT